MGNPQPIFDAIDRNTAIIFVLAGAAMLGNYVWFISALKVAKEHRAYSLPMFCTFFWLAHDSSFVFKYDDWFHKWGHWFPKLFWALLILTVLFELAYVAQIIKYGRAELAPWIGQAAFTAGVVVMAGAVMVFWYWLKHIMDDPVYLGIFALTISSYPPAAIIGMLHRRSRRGMTMTMCGGFLAMTVCYYAVSIAYFGPQFRSGLYIAVAVVTFALAIGMTLLYRSLPEYDPQSDPAGAADRSLVRA